MDRDDLPGERNHEQSPLWIVAQEPLVNALVGYLSEIRVRIEVAPGGPHALTFSRAELEEVRAAFQRMIRRGESKLHKLCSLFCDTFLPDRYDIESVVVAKVATTHERFVLSQIISPDELHSLTDLDLGNRTLEKLRYFDGTGFQRAQLVANFVEYQPFEMGDYGIYKIASRIKAEEEIWNKVVDAIFDIDRLVRRDKKLRELSRYVKDVFGLKVVVGTVRGVQRLQQVLTAHSWSQEYLEVRGIPSDEAFRRLKFVEVKDYLGANEQKESGWQAIKSVVQWWGDTFEIQVQPLRNYLAERERATKESHAGFKARRESLRDEIARAFPLFGFYRDLLQWLFRSPDEERPTFPGVTITLNP